MYETQYSYFINPATKKFLQTNEAHSPITTPPSFYFGDRPKFTLSFPADTIAEGDTLIAVLDNENRFLDTKQATGLNPVMAGVLHEVTSEEADSQSLEIQLFDYSKKFADVINGHDNAVTCLFTVYLKATDGEGNFTFIELGQTIANGEPTVTSPECVWDDLPVTKYYTREELDAVYNQFLAGVSLVVEYSNLAKSYAVGGTGTRQDEDTDNAKYYAEMASQAAQAVTTMYGEIQTLATQVANTKEYIDGLVASIAIDIRDISEIAASVTSAATQVSRDAQSVRQAKSSVDASVQFVSQAKTTIENLATQVSQNAVNVANDKDAVAQLAVQVSNAASQVSRDKADAKGYAESAATSLANVQTIQTDVTQKQTAVTTMKNTIQGWYNQISSWYNSIQSFMEQMQGWWTDVDTWQQQVSEDKDAAETARNEAVTAKNNAVTAKTAAETAQTKAETAQTKAETAQTKAETAQTKAETAQANAEKIAEGSDADVAPLGLEHSAKTWAQDAAAVLSSKRDILQTLVTSSSTALVAEAGKSYNWTVSAASTIALAAADKVAGKETRIDIYIDLQSGGSVSGSGVVISDAVLQSGWYKLIWDGTNATLYSTKAGGAASVITIPAATTSYTLQDNKHYQQVPDAVPTYTLPSATMDGLVHEITVLVDFLHVTSCSFVDASGVPVTLQSSISPQIGEAYIFRCYWYGKWRVVPLKIRNAATASSSNGVVEVSDAVAGNALALKMTAPKSVVVNQQINWASVGIGTVAGASNATILTDRSNRRSTITIVNVNTSNGISFAIQSNQVIGHVYMVAAYVTSSIDSDHVQIGYSATSNIVTHSVQADKKTFISGRIIFKASAGLIIYQKQGGGGGAVGSTFTVEDTMFIDLTQYFNGDQTLIDSITSWDDLVAYDPRFARYVAYNTGTVTGVQPQVKVTGKNLLDINRPAGTLTGSSAAISDTTQRTLDVSKYYIGLSSNNYYVPSYVYDASIIDGVITFTATNSGYGFSYPVYLKPNTQYIMSATMSSNGMLSVGFYDKYGNYITSFNNTTFTTPANTYIATITLRSISGNQTATFSNIQLELGSSATAYEAYHNGGSMTASAPLHGVGTARDTENGVSGARTQNIGSMNLGAKNWQASPSYPGCFYLENQPAIKSGILKGLVSSKLTILNQSFNWNLSSTYPDNIIAKNSAASNTFLYIKATSYADETALKTALDGVMLYYELATPVTTSVTPSSITLQSGTNVAMQTDGGRTLAELALTYENLPSDN